MKTELEIEQMKIEVQEKISNVQMKAEEAFEGNLFDLYRQYDREFAKLVAQYNILCEVLR